MIAWIDAVHGDYSRSRFILRAVPSAVKDEEEEEEEKRKPSHNPHT
jgi:hypothetical protein